LNLLKHNILLTNTNQFKRLIFNKLGNYKHHCPYAAKFYSVAWLLVRNSSILNEREVKIDGR